MNRTGNPRKNRADRDFGMVPDRGKPFDRGFPVGNGRDPHRRGGGKSRAGLGLFGASRTTQNNVHPSLARAITGRIRC